MNRHSAARAGLLVAIAAGCQRGLPAPEAGRWRLIEERRLGTVEEGTEGFGRIGSILVDRQERLWVLDSKSQEIRVFDSAGAFIRTIGRIGSGPGEFSGATGMVQGSNGVVWVQDPRNARLSGFDENGRLTGEVRASNRGFGYSWGGGVDSTGHLWDSFLAIDDSGQRTWRYRRFAADMTRADTVAVATCDRPPNRPAPLVLENRRGGTTIQYQPTTATAIDFNGRLACIPWSADYTGHLLDLIGGDTVGRFQRSRPMIPIPAAERDAEVARLTAYSQETGLRFAPSMVPTEQPAILQLRFDDHGRLWVQRLTVGGGAEFDRFDRDGRLEATITTPVSPAGPPIFRGERVYFAIAGPDDVPQVVRFRIERTPDGGR